MKYKIGEKMLNLNDIVFKRKYEKVKFGWEFIYNMIGNDVYYIVF